MAGQYIAIRPNYAIIGFMSTPEVRQYIISAEAPVTDWELALRFLGRLGIEAQPVNTTNSAPIPSSASMDVIEDGTIPYTLEKITSSEQYLSNEHLGEFWPEYRRNCIQNEQKSVNKDDALCWGLNMLAQPTPKDIRGYRLSKTQKREYAEKLGLKVVTPRSLVGFSDNYSPFTYGLWDHKEYDPSVIEVASFISSVRHISGLPITERPLHITWGVVRFFNALADKLEDQINNKVEGTNA